MPEIINTYDQLNKAKTSGLPYVAICTHFSQGTTYNYRDGWAVIQLGVDISEGQKQHWSEYLHKNSRERIFHRYNFKEAGDWRKQDKAALEAAIEWCKSRFPITEWAKNRQGDYVDKEVNKQFPINKSI